jgi:hypothetical protein
MLERLLPLLLARSQRLLVVVAAVLPWHASLPAQPPEWDRWVQKLRRGRGRLPPSLYQAAALRLGAPPVWE